MIRPFTVVVIGSECTGKTTLAAALAARLRAPWVPESAREYAERQRRALDASDVEPIARGQLAGEEAGERQAAQSGSGLVIRDTDLFSTAVYSRHYYGTCPPWVAAAAAERLGDVYLLLAPDVPWLPDGVRDRPDERARAEIHRLFVETLESAGARVVQLRGDWAAREAAAIAAVSAAIAAAPRPGSSAP